MLSEHTVAVGSHRGKEIPELATRPAQLTHAELAAQYGATQADLELVIATLTQLGLTCTASSAATRTVQRSGPVKAMEAAFAVQLFGHRAGGVRLGRATRRASPQGRWSHRATTARAMRSWMATRT